MKTVLGDLEAVLDRSVKKLTLWWLSKMEIPCCGLFKKKLNVESNFRMPLFKSTIWLVLVAPP